MNPFFEGNLTSKLVKKFYQGSVHFTLQPDEIQLMTSSWQEKFINLTFKNELILKYPVNKKFLRLYLKKILAYMENIQEIHDEFYIQLSSTMSNDTEQDGFFYRHYVIAHNLKNIVTIKETKNIVYKGTTGMKTWEAAFALSDWALCNKEIFTSKTVLELGSGVGFTGITIAKQCKPRAFLFSDCHNEVLKTICDNIRINMPQLNETEQTGVTYFCSENSSLGVMMLDWNDIEDVLDDLVPDVIIGADIVYDPVILEPLCNVLNYFYNKNRDLQVFIASVIRNEDTFAGFLKTLDSTKFEHEEIIPPKRVNIDRIYTNKIRILKIKRK